MYTTQVDVTGPCGVVFGSLNPTRFSAAAGGDATAFLRRKTYVKLFAEDFLLAWVTAEEKAGAAVEVDDDDGFAKEGGEAAP